MSKNAFSDSEKNRKPDNPQETLKIQNFYYSGFLAAEMSCSIIKAANYNPKGSHYYAIDLTVSNADKNLLKQVNSVVMENEGIITSIKGAYNLSARGKRKVQIVLSFLNNYPIITGDLARNRVDLLSQALEYLKTHRGHSKHKEKTKVMDTFREKLKMIKEKGKIPKSFSNEEVNKDAIGYFLSGVLDGDGSFGFKKSGNRQQPFILLAMKDKKIPILLKNFLGEGNVRFRKDGVYHFECNKSKALQKMTTLFLDKYPLQHKVQRERMHKLQRILNDHTQS